MSLYIYKVVDEFGSYKKILFFNRLNYNSTNRMAISFEMAINKCVNILDFFILQKCSHNLILRDQPVCPTYCIPQLISVQVITLIRSDEVQSISLLLIMENCLPFTDDVMVVLVHKCVQQTHLLALHLETLGYIPRH